MMRDRGRTEGRLGPSANPSYQQKKRTLALNHFSKRGSEIFIANFFFPEGPSRPTVRPRPLWHERLWRHICEQGPPLVRPLHRRDPPAP